MHQKTRSAYLLATPRFLLVLFIDNLSPTSRDTLSTSNTFIFLNDIRLPLANAVHRADYLTGTTTHTAFTNFIIRLL